MANMLTRRHFEFIAEEISRIANIHEKKIVAEHMARILSYTNSQFSQERFKEACEVKHSSN